MQEFNQFDESGQRHGYWEIFHHKGELAFKGKYINGVLDGYWIIFKKEYYYATM